MKTTEEPRKELARRVRDSNPTPSGPARIDLAKANRGIDILVKQTFVVARTVETDYETETVSRCTYADKSKGDPCLLILYIPFAIVIDIPAVLIMGHELGACRHSKRSTRKSSETTTEKPEVEQDVSMGLRVELQGIGEWTLRTKEDGKAFFPLTAAHGQNIARQRPTVITVRLESGGGSGRLELPPKDLERIISGD